MEQLSLRVIVMLEDSYYVAQCLEYDIAAQAKTLSELKDVFTRTLVSYLMIASEKQVEPFRDIGQAPKIYFDIYEKATNRLEKPFEITIPHEFIQREFPITTPRICEVALA